MSCQPPTRPGPPRQAPPQVDGARALNLLGIEERRLTAFRNASNVVRITDASWRAWLRLRPPGKGGVKTLTRSPTQEKELTDETSSQTAPTGRQPPLNGYRGPGGLDRQRRHAVAD